jgi:hypothetical protein
MYQIVGPHHHYTISHAVIAIIAVLAIWEIVWKGMALWRAGRNRQLGWFVAMLILNTVGILEIVYILFFQKKSGSKADQSPKPLV